ncbi:hypothetical protein [Cellulomonas sp. ATA003]|uniref:hypothetical protein n=1 Tax=Cellulomonas sp. ATA003 TaxID=3073064 RepID=UPI002872D969|nr:hypothetical protein [Cellulomonas sp. ATA003]WNB85410.1 hypothetical protein REH70_17800 [Cellulomonas sp. ATA003]
MVVTACAAVALALVPVPATVATSGVAAVGHPAASGEVVTATAATAGTAAITTAVTAAGAAATPLSFSPPELTNPTIVKVSASNRNLKLDVKGTTSSRCPTRR